MSAPAMRRDAAMRPVYLDHNATTPIDPLVVQALQPFLADQFGNPASAEHFHGHEAAQAVERAREQVAESIGARSSEVVFTGSCTEANNMAIVGSLKAQPGKSHVVTSSIEHPSVLVTLQALERAGTKVTYLPVDSSAMVDPEAVRRAVTPDTALVSIMGANNEVGTIQPIIEIGRVCSELGVQFHSDLAQCIPYLGIDVKAANLHLASMSGHKAYGPKGQGALYVRGRSPRALIAPILHGGGQERGLRPGTLNVPWIVAMGEAFHLCRKRREKDSTHLRALNHRFHEHLARELEGLEINGDPERRLPNNLSISIRGVEPLALMRLLRDRVSFSASSACSTLEVKTSPVLLAMFGDTDRARGAFRVAPGRYTTEYEMDFAAHAFVEGCRRLRSLTR